MAAVCFQKPDSDISSANWVTLSKFSMQIDFDVLHCCTWLKRKPEVWLRRYGRHIENGYDIIIFCRLSYESGRSSISVSLVQALLLRGSSVMCSRYIWTRSEQRKISAILRCLCYSGFIFETSSAGRRVEVCVSQSLFRYFRKRLQRFSVQSSHTNLYTVSVHRWMADGFSGRLWSTEWIWVLPQNSLIRYYLLVFQNAVLQVVYLQSVFISSGLIWVFYGTIFRSRKNCVHIWGGYLLIWRRFGFERAMDNRYIDREKVGQHT